MPDRDMSNYKTIHIDRLTYGKPNHTPIPEGSTYLEVTRMVDDAVINIRRHWREVGLTHWGEEWHHSGLFCNLYTINGKVLVGVSFGQAGIWGRC